jgi:phosphate transport system permease protein
MAFVKHDLKIASAKGRASNAEWWIERVLLAATSISAVAIVSIFILLIYFCIPLFTSSRALDILSWQWQPFAGKFGILAMCEASLGISVLALVLAFPPAVAMGCLISVLAPGPMARLFSALVHFMTSIPTVIYGFASVFLLVPLVREWFQTGSGFSLLTAALTLSLLILPTIVLVFQSALDGIDPSLRPAAEAMGFTPVQCLRHVLVPAASRGLMLAAILGFGRAVGDTLISLMLAGNAAQHATSPLVSVRSLTAHIALVLATDSHSMAYQSVFASGLILFLIMGAVSCAIRRLGGKRKYDSIH